MIEETGRSITPIESKELVEIPEKQPQSLIPDDQIVKYYEEALDCIRSDRNEAGDRYLAFCDMIINGGDPSSSTKEAMVNLLKIKTDSVDRMIKILDLWSKQRTREQPRPTTTYNLQQNNKLEVNKVQELPVRKLLEQVSQMRDQVHDDN